MAAKSGWMKWIVLIFTLSLLVSCGGGGGTPEPGPGPGPSPGTSLPDLVVTAFSAPSSGTAGNSFTVTGTITNQGGAAAAGVSAVIYLSPSSNVAVDGGQVGLDVYVGILDIGQSWNFSVSVDLPTNVANGSYYIGAVALYGDEADKNNNTRSQAFTITGGTTCTPDSYESDNSAGAAKQINLGESQQHNHCEGTSDWLSFNATQGTTYGISTSQLGYEAWTGIALYDPDGQTVLASGSSYVSWEFGASRLSWTAPANGKYYLKVYPIFGLNSSGANTEYHVTLGDQGPDLIVEYFYASDTGLPGGIISVSDSVLNQGFADAGSFEVSVYISSETVVTAATGTLIGTRTVSSLPVGQSDSSYSLYYTLPASLTPGTYYLAAIVNPGGSNEVVTSNNTSAVSAITINAPSGCTPDSYEEDDSYTAAKTITVGAAPQPHNHCEDSADWLKFTAEAGKDYAVRVTRVGGYAYPGVKVYDTDGTTCLAGCTSGTTAIDWQAPASVTYYLKVEGSTGAGTDYTVMVQPQLPDLTQTLSTVYGNTVVAGGFLYVSDLVSNMGYTTAGVFEVGVYRSLDGTVDMSDTLAATRQVSGLSAQGYANTNYAWYDVQFPKSLPTGTYYLAAIADRGDAVTELSESNNTSAPIAVSVVAPPCAWDAYEDDDYLVDAKPINAGDTQSRNFCDDSLDWVKFIPSANGVYVANSTYPDLELYQSDGTTRITPQDTYPGTNYYSRLSWAASAGTTYYLKSYNGSGAYQLTVFQCAQDAFEEDDSSAAAKAISLGQTQSRNLCEDGHDWAKFTATTGTTYTISVTKDKNLSLDLTLYDTDGQTWLASGQSAQGGQKQVITWTAPASGTYYIEVRPMWGFGQNTDYTLSLN